MAYHGCLVYEAAADQTIGDSSSTVVTFSAESFDTDAYHSLVANTGRITVPAGLAGLYRVYASMRWESAAGGTRILRIHLNGVAIIVAETHCQDEVITPYQLLEDTLELEVGDYLDVRVYQDSGGNLDTIKGAWTTYFGADLLGEHA